MIEFRRNINGMALIQACYDRPQYRAVRRIYQRQYPAEQLLDLKVVSAGNVSYGAIIALTPNVVRVFIAGIWGQIMALNVAAGFVSESQTADSQGFNAAAWEDALNLHASIQSRFSRPQMPLEVHGHSAGGMIAEALAKSWGTYQRGQAVQIDTYGSPCPAQSGRFATENVMSRQRWMNSDDPVPFVPWANMSTGNHLLMWLYGLATAKKWGEEIRPERFRQPGAGYRLLNGNIAPALYPLMAGDPQRAVQEWLASQPVQVRAHAAETYLGKFIALYRKHPEGFPPFPATMHAEVLQTNNVAIALPALPLPPGEVGLVMPLEIRPDGIALDTNHEPVGTVQIERQPMAFLRINPRFAFRRVRVGRAWHVTLGESIIAVCDEPKTPRTLVKRLNGMLRAVGTDNTIFLGAFVEALSAWMIQATTDESYCKPTMRVDP